MEFLPPGVNTDAWHRLCELWVSLPEHPNLLPALKWSGRDALLLRYAALNWRRPPLELASFAARDLAAAWGRQITDVFLAIVEVVKPAHYGELARPFVFIDVGDQARVGFLPVQPQDVLELPPELRGKGTDGDERTLVWLVGKLLRELCAGLDGVPELARIVTRCREIKPSRRFRGLVDLCPPGSEAVLRTGDELAAWQLAEEGLGWVELGQNERAKGRFHRAAKLDPGLRLATEGMLATKENPIDLRVPPFEYGPLVFPLRKRLTWAEAVEQAAPLEAACDFRAAAELYLGVEHAGPHELAL